MGAKLKRSAQNWSVKKKLIASLIIIVLIIIFIFSFFIINAIRTSPKVNPSNILNEMNLNSVILDEDGNLLEQLRSDENRTIVQLNEIPKDLQDAIIAIEDQRFRSHSGLDFKGIGGAIIANIKSRGIVRGASTLTQQLAKNVYLTSEIKFDRKIKEALIARKLEKSLSKDQILEAYLNSIYLGEGAYGVQEAASTYFDKDVSELSLGESALIAGITKNPSSLVPYYLVKPESVNQDSIVIGEKDILGEKYTAVFNPQSLERQKVILDKMVELGYITSEEASEASNENIEEKLVVKNEEKKDISSYFSDYLKESVIEDLINEQGYTEEDAERKLYTGGFKIYATVDSDLQAEIEDIYDNLSNYINMSSLSTWKNDENNNIISDGNNPGIVYYSKNNLLNSEDNVIIDSDEFKKNSNGDIVIDSQKLNIYSGAIDINDYYTVDNMGNLLVHDMGRLSLSPENYKINEDGTVVFKSQFLNEHPDFGAINDDGNFIIDKSYFSNDEDGIVQPQSATVIIDQSTGYVKAMVGGRSNNGKKVVNRATKPRQTGSIMKPIGAYLPALDNGFTAATPIDDVPFLNDKGEVWPNNYDFRSRGLMTLRESVEQSINTNAVKTVDQIGIKKSMSYLEKMGIISKNGNDTFVTAKEDKKYNDENLSALALGGLTHGISPVKMTGAYASIANQGKYLKTTAYSKIEDHNGEIIMDNKADPVKVVSPETAYVMTDILHTTVSNGLAIAQKARIRGDNETIPVAGKTGTTDQNADVWFSGFTPYYTASVWVGNDSMSIKLSRDSGLAAEIWSTVMKKAHENLEPKQFEEPENIVRAQVCTLSGKAPSRNCELDPRNVVKEEIFAKGTEPEQPCEQHVYLRVHRRTNNLAGPSCPSYLTFSKLFFKREPAYDPSKHNNVLPEDHEYDPPLQTTNCN
ncbi:MAG: PBP1A family penicillin-binding protein [Andreesenia angusta]|nr:PBP1A family penicillin-binding protein [Andreesenia angusta]